MTTNNFDEFDQEDMAPNGVDSSHRRGGMSSSLSEAWRTRPLFKLVVIMIVVGAAIVVSLSFASAPQTPETSRLVKAPDLNETPGGKSNPYFIEQNKQAANQRADQAMQQGGSAIPTPVGQAVDMGELDKKDPLIEFRAETERLKQELKQEQQQNAVQIQQIQQKVQQPPAQPFDDSLAQAMQRQLQLLSESWKAQSIKVVAGADRGSSIPSVNAATATGSSTSTSGASNAAVGSVGNVNSGAATSGPYGTSSDGSITSQVASNAASVQAINKDKIIVPAGTISYAQLITEANSDVPGPILAQIVSGPFAGARAIGRFVVEDDYIAMTFTLVNYKDKDYGVNALALNPNTTLGGMATEVDPRYVMRVVLPAAASFVSAFGSAISSTSSTTTVTDNAVISSSAKKGVKDGLYSGLGEAGDTVSQFMKDQANKTKQLVRIAAGTPMGMFFTTTVRENASQAAAGLGAGQTNTQNTNGSMGYTNGTSSNPYSMTNSTSNSNSNVRIYGPSGSNYYNNGTSNGASTSSGSTYYSQ